MDFKDELSERVKIVDEYMENFLPSDKYPKEIFEAMRYSVFAGGKRLRPIMVMEACNAFGGDWKDSMSFACAIEMIHTYSLVHDDLPAMDNDAFRRGKMTTHTKFGEDIGVLAGDGLLNLAYEIMSEALLNSERMDRAARAMQVIAKKAGIYGMVGGQTVDVENEGKKMTIDTVMYIHNLKTAALIEASMMAGAILAGATAEQIDIVEKMANKVGIAFQIQDDILDVTSTTEQLGKPALSDEKNQKTTYVSLLGVDISKEHVKRYSREAIELLESLGGNNKFLKFLFIKLINREK